MKKINDKERVLYFIIISIQFIIIVFYFIHLINIKSKIRQSGIKFNTMQKTEHFGSFIAINRLKKEELLQFSPSLKKYYIFIYISSDCHYCSEFIEKFNIYLIGHEIDKEIEIVYISQTDYSKRYLIDGFKFLIVKDNSILQKFGLIVPMLFVVNGKGDVLFQTNKPVENTFNYVFESIQIDKKKNY